MVQRMRPVDEGDGKAGAVAVFDCELQHTFDLQTYRKAIWFSAYFVLSRRSIARASATDHAGIAGRACGNSNGRAWQRRMNTPSARVYIRCCVGRVSSQERPDEIGRVTHRSADHAYAKLIRPRCFVRRPLTQTDFHSIS